MRVGHAGDLRQVRDAEHLLVLRDEGDALGDHLGRAAADARVDLIEDHARHGRVARGGDRLDGERDARELASGGDSLQWLFRLAGVGREEHGDFVAPLGAVICGRLHADGELRLRHAEREELLFDGRGKVLGRGSAQLRQGSRLLPQLLLERGDLLFERGDVLVVVLDL